MPSSGIFELSGITGGTGAVRSDNVLPMVDVHDATQAAQGSLIKITLAQLYRTETTAVTVSTPLPDIAQTWNNAAVTFTAVKLNVTSTASAAASLLLDLQVGGASKFSVRKDGGITGLLLTAAQTNITSVGILASPHVTTLTVDSGGITVTSGTTAVQALTVALQATFNGTAAQIGGFYQLSATTTSIAWQAGNNTGNGFKWIQDESVTGNAMLVRINAGVDATMMTFTRASGLVTLAAGLTVGGAVSGVTTLAMGGALSGVTTLNASGLATLGAGIALTGTLTFATAVSKIVPGATSISHRNNADNADNLIITDAGAATFRSTIDGVTTLTCTTVTATNLGGTLSTAAQPNITSVGQLSSLIANTAQTSKATVSCTTATSTTVGTLVAAGTYQVNAYIPGITGNGVGSMVVSSNATPTWNGTAAVLVGNISAMSIDSSGTIKVTQNTGSTVNVTSVWLRLN